MPIAPPKTMRAPRIIKPKGGGAAAPAYSPATAVLPAPTTKPFAAPLAAPAIDPFAGVRKLVSGGNRAPTRPIAPSCFLASSEGCRPKVERLLAHPTWPIRKAMDSMVTNGRRIPVGIRIRAPGPGVGAGRLLRTDWTACPWYPDYRTLHEDTGLVVVAQKQMPSGPCFAREGAWMFGAPSIVPEVGPEGLLSSPRFHLATTLGNSPLPSSVTHVTTQKVARRRLIFSRIVIPLSSPTYDQGRLRRRRTSSLTEKVCWG